MVYGTNERLITDVKKDFSNSFEAIGRALFAAISAPAKTVWLEFRQYRASASVKVACESKDDPGIVKPVDMERKNSLAILDLCKVLWTEMSAAGENPWTAMTLTVRSDGKFEMDFEYTDFYSPEFNASDYSDQWEAKYFTGLKRSWKDC